MLLLQAFDAWLLFKPRKRYDSRGRWAIKGGHPAWCENHGSFRRISSLKRFAPKDFKYNFLSLFVFFLKVKWMKFNMAQGGILLGFYHFNNRKYLHNRPWSFNSFNAVSQKPTTHFPWPSHTSLDEHTWEVFFGLIFWDWWLFVAMLLLMLIKFQGIFWRMINAEEFAVMKPTFWILQVLVNCYPSIV